MGVQESIRGYYLNGRIWNFNLCSPNPLRVATRPLLIFLISRQPLLKVAGALNGKLAINARFVFCFLLSQFLVPYFMIAILVFQGPQIVALVFSWLFQSFSVMRTGHNYLGSHHQKSKSFVILVFIDKQVDLPYFIIFLTKFLTGFFFLYPC